MTKQSIILLAMFRSSSGSASCDQQLEVHCATTRVNHYEATNNVHSAAITYFRLNIRRPTTKSFRPSQPPTSTATIYYYYYPARSL